VAIRQMRKLEARCNASMKVFECDCVITCVVEPPEDALPAARVRARLRYDKLVRAAAEGISSKNKDTLKEMVADE
jgi:hypothetical protein